MSVILVSSLGKFVDEQELSKIFVLYGEMSAEESAEYITQLVAHKEIRIEISTKSKARTLSQTLRMAGLIALEDS